MSSNSKTLFIVEDNPADTLHYLRLLDEVKHDFKTIETSTTLADACERMSQQPPLCCLLDYNLPDGSALSFLELLKTKFENGLCPIIVITGQEDTETAVKLMQHGAQDYLVKQKLDAEQLLRVIQHSIQTWQLQRQLNHLALYDPLTSLVNRTLFIDRLIQMFEAGKRNLRPFALLYIDIDYFKAVNDNYGHEAGDYMLKSMAEQLLANMRSTDTAARLGGDEFSVLLPDISEAKAHHFSHKLVQALTLDLPWKDGFISIAPSIGLACYPSRADSYQEFMREADFALYRAKNNGRGQYSAFNKAMETETRQLTQLSSALPKVLLNQGLQIAYQPIIDVSTLAVDSIEALVRWKFKQNWISPEKIIELVLERRLSESFHQWLFENTIQQLSDWQRSAPDLSLALNLPANICHDAKLLNQLLSVLKDTSIDPQKITVEVTETHMMQYPDETKLRLKTLADFGVQISIDDFGTGYSSMQYLASLPCDTLKIDRQFFMDLNTNERNAQIIEAITALSHRLGLKVIAEGIETAELLQAATEFGCDYAQGYWLGAPVITQQEFSAFCVESKRQGDRLIAKV